MRAFTWLDCRLIPVSAIETNHDITLPHRDPAPALRPITRNCYVSKAERARRKSGSRSMITPPALYPRSPYYVTIATVEGYTLRKVISFLRRHRYQPPSGNPTRPPARAGLALLGLTVGSREPSSVLPPPLPLPLLGLTVATTTATAIPQVFSLHYYYFSTGLSFLIDRFNRSTLSLPPPWAHLRMVWLRDG